MYKRQGLDFLRQVCAAVDLPVYAIGGIKFDETQWMSLKECGAAGGCIMSVSYTHLDVYKRQSYEDVRDIKKLAL